ncbi:MAG: hypothetical protein LBS51_01790 [Oscillospiraceae bacterium]|jgi:hypothetical protein|nr:hypothetical protein [Oscillospiraceae bacterium]
MQQILPIVLLIGVSIVIYYVMRAIRRGANRLISGGSYKLEKEMTGQVWEFESGVDKESLIATIKNHFPETSPRLAWKGNWICARNGDMLGFAYGVVSIEYATGTIRHVKAGMKFTETNGTTTAVFNFISWTQSNGVCPYAKEMVTLTETLKALVLSVDSNAKITSSAHS